MKSNSKLWTIISHEYLKRIKTKGFLIGTLLGPFSLVLFFGIIVLVSMSFDDSSRKLMIIDRTNSIGKELIAKENSKYTLSDKDEKTLKSEILKDKIDGYVLIPEDILEKGEVNVYTKGGGGIGYVVEFERNIEKIVRYKRLNKFGADEKVIKLVEEGVKVKTQKVNEEGKIEKDNTASLSFVGYILGFAIYILTFIYGSFVSRGVIEEKVNRISEIIASSVRPFEMMFGKVVGIGFVGLTQVLFWILIVSSLFYFSIPIIKMVDGNINAEQIAKMNTMMQSSPSGGMMGKQMSSPQAVELMNNIPSISIWIGIGFVFYFLAGYFMYATLFAAVGSAVDTEQDAAQLQLPITMPIILTIMLIPHIMSNPDSSLSVFLSLFPFSSPITMVVRIAATTVPLYQVALSILFIVIGFLGSLWFASKVYRIGILMTGKKPSFKDLIKWARM
ncbi:MAG: ABC transporter permease [Candidatus Kapabacteria bacterium]|nr:ABC transporter permease [Candidatus Kapabacteria bacterium]